MRKKGPISRSLSNCKSERALLEATELKNRSGTRLRASTGMRYALLNPILDELVREGRIRISEEIRVLL